MNKSFNKKVLANRIKEQRKLHNLSQSEFAKILHVSQQTIGSWETGRAVPGSDTLTDLADYFNTSTDYLNGRINDPRPLEEILHQKDGLTKSLEVDLAKDPVVLAYDGIPVSDEDKEIIEAVLERHNKKKI